MSDPRVAVADTVADNPETASELTPQQALEAKTIINPFIDEINYNVVYNYFKVVFLAPVAVIRILWIFLIVCIGYLFTVILGEKQLTRYFGIIPRVLLLGFGFYHVPVKNLQALETAKRENAIAVYNHVSFFDGALMSAYVHPFAHAINSVHGSVCILAKVVVKLHFVLIDYARGSGQTAKIKDHVDQGRNMLVIAPEGTTSNGKALLKFRSGAFVPLRPIQPILIRFPHRHMNPAWTYITDTRVILWRSLTQFVNFAEIELLPLMHPLEAETPAEYAGRVRLAMAAGLGVPALDLSREDGFDYVKKVAAQRDEFGSRAKAEDDVESCWPCGCCRKPNRVASSYAE